MTKVKCQDCSFEFEDTLKSCPNCGLSNSENVEHESYIICEECGNHIPKDSIDCPVCGYPIKEDINEPISHEKVDKPIKVKKRSYNFKPIIFYTSLVIIFFAGCFTAIFLSTKLLKNKNKEKDNEPKTYKINRTLSCINENNNEEHNYYFDQNKLVQYGRYSLKDYKTDSKADKEIKAFKDKWENNKSYANITANKKYTQVEEAIILDLINSDNVELEDDVKITDNYNKIKGKMEDKGWTCTDYDKDLGTKLPINENTKRTSD